MKQLTVATLKLFGDHAALDFTNTVNSRGERFGPDVLRSYGDLLDWGTRLGVLDAAEAETLRGLAAERGKAALARAKALREALYRIFATRPSADPVDLAVLRSGVRAAQEAHILLPEADGYAWRWRPDDPDTVTHRRPRGCRPAHIVRARPCAYLPGGELRLAIPRQVPCRAAVLV
jgi:hypothetical protein